MNQKQAIRTLLENDNPQNGLNFSLPPISDDPAPGGQWLYHATATRNLPSIAKEGLVPGPRSLGKGAGLSFTPHLDSAHFWTAALFTRDNNTALLRVPRRAVVVAVHDEQDEYDPHDGTAEDASYRPVAVEFVEVYVNGQWKKIREVQL